MKTLNLITATAVAITMAATVGLAYSAEAQTVRLGAGKPGLGYDAKMQMLAGRLVGQAKISATVQNFAGSEDIANAICAGDIDLAPAQIDAVYRVQKAGCDLIVIGVYGEGEHAMILFPPNSRYDELHDLKKGDRIIVGPLGSGSALTWDTMVEIETEEGGSSWLGAVPEYEDHDTAEGRGAMGDVAALFIVTTPNQEFLQQLQRAGWKFGDLDDGDLDDRKINDQPLYTAGEIEDMEGDDHDTYIVRTLYIANGKFGRDSGDVATKTKRLLKSLR